MDVGKGIDGTWGRGGKNCHFAAGYWAGYCNDWMGGNMRWLVVGFFVFCSFPLFFLSLFIQGISGGHGSVIARIGMGLLRDERGASGLVLPLRYIILCMKIYSSGIEVRDTRCEIRG